MWVCKTPSEDHEQCDPTKLGSDALHRDTRLGETHGRKIGGIDPPAGLFDASMDAARATGPANADALGSQLGAGWHH